MAWPQFARRWKLPMCTQQTARFSSRSRPVVPRVVSGRGTHVREVARSGWATNNNKIPFDSRIVAPSYKSSKRTLRTL